MKDIRSYLNADWLELLQLEFDKPYMKSLAEYLAAEKAAGKVVYPALDQVFAALNATAAKDIRIVVLGQDPYHQPNQAHGLSFSVQGDQAVPPSLKNIYKELNADLGCSIPKTGNLISWAKQGVLLLNAVLTVRESAAASHQGKGWEQFTDSVIELVSARQRNVVFLLWGSSAQKKGQKIDRDRHLVLHAPHPSPLSAYRGFFGCQHFSKANDYLEKIGKTPIDWQIQ